MSNQPSQRSSDVIDAIFGNNAGRDPERLTLKYAKMAQSPFIFLRGACHLFYDHLPYSRLFGDITIGSISSAKNSIKTLSYPRRN